jgi:predicted nucleic acid-binding protein
MTGVEACFVDTNVLLAACDEGRPSHENATRLLEEALAGRRNLYASGQVFREFLVVATRPPKANGLGMSAGDALANVAEFSRCIRLLDENEAVSRRLRDLIRRHRLKGKRIHDANIVATLLVHGLDRLVTDNAADFKVFEQIATLSP